MKDQLILELLSQCGVTGKPNHKGELSPLNFCMFHEHNFRSPSLSVNVENGAYYCYSCHATGHVRSIFYHCGLDVGDLFSNVKNRGDFAEFLDNLLVEFTPTDDERNVADENELENYRFVHPYLIERGFSRDVLLRNRVGYDKSSARATIPIWFDGNYYGCIKRTVIDQQPKYLYPKNLQKSAIFYSPRMMVSMGGNIFVEGSLDALKGAESCHPTHAILGCKFSNKQLQFLNTCASPFLFMDNDEAGIKGTHDVLQRCSRNDILIARYPEGKTDPGSLTVEEFRWAVDNAMHRLEWFLFQ